MSIIVAILLGVLIGIVVMAIGFMFLVVGVLRVDHSDFNDSPYLFLELSKELPFVINKKYVILKVSRKNYIDTDSSKYNR